MDTRIAHFCEQSGEVGLDYLLTYRHTPLDFARPPPGPKSPITPFWLGFGAALRPSSAGRNHDGNGRPQLPAETFADSSVHPQHPQDGISIALMVYPLHFQVLYLGLHVGFAYMSPFPSWTEWYLWMGSTAVDFGLIAVYVLTIPAGTYFALFLGRQVYDMGVTNLLEVASALPAWAKLLIHAPFGFDYVVARAAVLGESILRQRALPRISLP
ncbi:hypothetical protein N657DRAFT_649887 [Parathielavia appendiculata]|uniref:Uncharacterized protein n=1 Tax=Parathielavia appendiculata TaxID=2587402 RepID=A0AAN6TT94_9PEZI|nr:hypothetical protein N657DRAFT_649887 [Parathielavia appendiculata]